VPEAVQNILSSRLFSTRAGTIAVGVFAALLALLVLLLYLSHYRSSVKAEGAPVPVLVAKHLIPQGTAGDALGTSDGFEATEVPKSSVKVGALSDPSVLKGRVAVSDIYPGQQLTLADFTPTATATLGSRLVGKQRAMSIPLDSVHGMLGTVVPGDRVDIYVFNKKLAFAAPILQNVLVLGGAAAATAGINASQGGNFLTLRVTPRGAQRLAATASSEDSTLWVVLRPATRGGVLRYRFAPLLRRNGIVPEGDQ
jgi:pilus assembly protein CpaB